MVWVLYPALYEEVGGFAPVVIGGILGVIADPYELGKVWPFTGGGILCVDPVVPKKLIKYASFKYEIKLRAGRGGSDPLIFLLNFHIMITIPLVLQRGKNSLF